MVNVLEKDYFLIFVLLYSVKLVIFYEIVELGILKKLLFKSGSFIL